MDRTTLLWTVVVFFAASLVFAAIRELTKNEDPAVTYGIQTTAGVLLIGVLVAIVRGRR